MSEFGRLKDNHDNFCLPPFVDVLLNESVTCLFNSLTSLFGPSFLLLSQLEGHLSSFAKTLYQTIEKDLVYSPSLGFFQVVPIPIFHHIFSFLDKNNEILLSSLRLTCKLFYHFMSPFWTQIIPLNELDNYKLDTYKGVVCSIPKKLILDIRPSATKIDLSFLPSLKELTIANDYFESSYQIYQYEIDITKLPSDLSIFNFVSCNNITCESIHFLPSNLQTLNLSKSNVYNFYNQLKNLPSNLLNLDLSFSNITNEVIKHLPTTITFLNLKDCPNINDNCITNLPPNLLTLNLSKCSITYKGLKHLPLNLLNLDLSYCSIIPNSTLKYLPKNLSTLNLFHCLNITDEGLQYLPKNLSSLDLSYCLNITDEGLQYLPKNLSSLNLSNCPDITQDGLKSLSSHIKLIR